MARRSPRTTSCTPTSSSPNPKNTSNALSNFGGVLTPSGVQKVDDFTVAFHLAAPNGNFPYLTSSDNYNMIIIPNGYNPANWQSSFIGTGPFVLKSYTAKVGASFTRNESYWGTKALPAETQFTFYADQTPEILALSDGSIDVVGQFAVAGAEQLLTSAPLQHHPAEVERAPRALHALRPGPVHRPAGAPGDRAHAGPPGDRQALFKGYADIGNDSPFAPVFPSTNTSVAQRTQNIAKAKSLLAAAGHPNGFSTHLTTEQFLEIPEYAQIVAQSAKAIGVTIGLTVESSSAYYGKATFGNSDWLDATMSLVDYGHRSVPNVFLTAPLETINAKTGTGSWNAAHFNNSQYDSLVAQYIATVDLSTQRTIAGKIETLLLDQTPVIFGYFYNYLTATGEERERRLPDRDRPYLPVQRDQELSSARRRGPSRSRTIPVAPVPVRSRHRRARPDRRRDRRCRGRRGPRSRRGPRRVRAAGAPGARRRASPDISTCSAGTCRGSGRAACPGSRWSATSWTTTPAGCPASSGC